MFHCSVFIVIVFWPFDPPSPSRGVLYQYPLNPPKKSPSRLWESCTFPVSPNSFHTNCFWLQDTGWGGGGGGVFCTSVFSRFNLTVPNCKDSKNTFTTLSSLAQNQCCGAGAGHFCWSQSRWKSSGSGLLLCVLGVLWRQRSDNSHKM